MVLFSIDLNQMIESVVAIDFDSLWLLYLPLGLTRRLLTLNFDLSLFFSGCGKGA